MQKVISIGKQNFVSLRENDCFYIDKTDLICKWWESKDEITLITRPRRFGKTLNMSMLNCFFSNQFTGREDLFKGLAVWKKEKYRKMQGTYPVIFLSFAAIKGSNYEDARDGIIMAINEAYSEHRYLLESNELTDGERKCFEELDYYAKNPGIKKQVANDTICNAVKNLANCLSRYYKKKVIILLDEYDTPMQEAYIEGYWERLVSFTRSLFNASFKTNPFLERAIMTGITRVSKESVFSDLNNLVVITTTSDAYATSFGFTEQEVFHALEEFGKSEKQKEVKNWYDGFTFGGISDIYNPWSILNYLKTGKIASYWTNTSSNRFVGSLIRESGRNLKMDFENLLKGGMLRTMLDEQVVFSQLDHSETAIWSMLLASGYLKIADHETDTRTGREYYTLALTNREVQLMFENIVHDWFAEGAEDYNDFIKGLLSGDVEAMNCYMNRITKRMFSYFDTGKKQSDQEPERFYHGFVLGLIVELENKYQILSNRESGFGRYDVVLEPLDKKEKAFIIEFKVRNPKTERTLEDTVQTALGQIKEKEYAVGLENSGILKENICAYGIAFEGKKVLIGEA